MDQRNVVMPAEQRHHLSRLAGPQQAVIDKDTGQLLADRLVDQHRRHRGIHPARQAADHLAVSHLRADRLDRTGAVRGHRPASRTAADPQRKTRQQRAAILGMDHLGMELHAVIAALVIRHGGKGRAGGCGDNPEPGRQLGDMVAMAHPDGAGLACRPQPFEQGAALADLERGAAELAAGAGLDPSAKLLAHGLLAITDAENRHIKVEHLLRGARRVRHRHRIRSARQDDPARRGSGDLCRIGGAGQDFGVDAGLAEAPCDELCHL